MKMEQSRATIEIGIGSGARAAVAYANVTIPEAAATSIRLSLHVTVKPALRGRDVAYAALAAAAEAARASGIRRAIFRIDDASIADDLREHRAVPAALAIPYVTLRCLLNRFEEATVVSGRTRGMRDLAARARADVAFSVAA